MEMNQLQAILHPFAIEKIERFEKLTGCQAEFAGIATRFFPLATTGRSQFDADTDIRLYIQLLRHLGNQLQFIHFLYDKEDTFTHLLRKQSQFNITFVLITVADNQ